MAQLLNTHTYTHIYTIVRVCVWVSPCNFFGINWGTHSSQTGYKRWFFQDITMTSWWARWRLKSPASRLFTWPFIQISKLRVTGLCAGNPPVTGEFPQQMASDAENDSIWWCHHENEYLFWSTSIVVSSLSSMWFVIYIMIMSTRKCHVT